MPRFETEDIKQRHPLLDYIKRDLSLDGTKKGKGWMFPCPFHGGTGKDDGGSLCVTEDPAMFYCYGCKEGGDVIAYVMKREGLSFPAACDRLGGKVDDDAEQRPAARRPAVVVKPPPPTEFQDVAETVSALCVETLWSDAGKQARQWLHARGLNEETLRFWDVGYNPNPLPTTLWDQRHGRAVELPAGITIPAYMDGHLYGVKVHRMGLDPTAKYKSLAGSVSCLYGTTTITGHKPIVITEGEFDAMLLFQEAGDLVSVVSSTGGAAKFDPAWSLHFLGASHVFAALDDDDTGRRSAERLAAMSRRIQIVTVPDASPSAKGWDITDFHKAGGSLRAWVQSLLAATLPPPPPEIVCDFTRTTDPFPPSEGDHITTEVNGFPQQGRVLTVWDDGTLLAQLDGWPVESYLHPQQYAYTGRRTTHPQEETQ